MTSLSDAEFDGRLDDFVRSTMDLLKTHPATEYFTTACLAYEDRLELHTLVSDDGCSDTYESVLEFGKALKTRGTVIPPCLFVGAEFEWMDGTPCIVISGCTPDGRRNGVKLDYTRTRWRKRIQITKLTTLYRQDGATFNGRTYAGQLMRGLTE
jgi:hypothetical protein